MHRRDVLALDLRRIMAGYKGLASESIWFMGAGRQHYAGVRTRSIRTQCRRASGGC